MKILGLICFVLLVFLFSGCSVSGSYRHLEKFEMEALAAPELRGANGFREPNTSKMRLSANVQIGEEEKERLSGIVNEVGDCSAISGCKGFDKFEVNENVDATYKMGFSILTASLDYQIKYDLLMWGWGISINKGLFGSLFLGVNTKYFEVGAALGLWGHTRSFSYSGADYDCVKYLLGGEELESNSFEATTDIGFAATYGGFASAYYGPLSLSFSFNVYRPDPSYPDGSSKMQADFEFPLVMTEYIVVAYRLNENVEFRLGAANTFGEFHGWHWSATGGMSYYL